MPRKAKGSPAANAQRTDQMAGSGGQRPQAPTGMPQGDHAESIQSQKLMPVAGGAPPPPGPAPSPAGGGAPTPPGAAPAGGNPLQDALAMASPMNGLLPGPSIRPNEPVTAGLTSGAGPGPAPITQDTPRASQLLSTIAQSSRNPAIAELAALAARMSA